MRCAHILPKRVTEASGVSISVPNLVGGLHAAGVGVSLHVGGMGDVGDVPYPVTNYPFTFGEPPYLGWSPKMRAGLRAAAREHDILHNHSLWMMPNVYPAGAVQSTPCKLVCSPRGTLSEWALNRSRWKKKLMWWAGQSAALRRADCLHATSAAEHTDIRRNGLRPPVAVIPNGVDVPETLPEPVPRERRTVLYLGRIHPIKGLDRLIEAWALLEREAVAADWELRLVGPGEAGHLAAVKDAIVRAGVSRVSLPGPAFGNDKWTEYASADLYVLPSHSENFAISVAEALACGCPVVVSKGAPWSGVAEHRCGWWCENTPQELAACVRQAMTLPQADLADMGQSGRAWMQRDFSWRTIGEAMKTVYEWLLDRGPMPACVRLD